MFIKSLKIVLSLFFIGCLGCVHERKPEPTPTPTPLPPAEISEKTVINFDFDSVKLSKSQKKLLEQALFGKSQEVQIHVVGYTDSQGSTAYNQTLSERRATTVVKFLQKNLRVKGNISAEGKGETLLLNADKTLKQHKENRRVELTII